MCVDPTCEPPLSPARRSEAVPVATVIEDADIASLHVLGILVRFGHPQLLRAIAEQINRRAGR